MFDKSTRSKQVCQLLLSLIVAFVSFNCRVSRSITSSRISREAISSDPTAASVTVIKLFFNNVFSKQLQQLHSQNGRLHSLNEPHVITAPKSWGEARLVS